jgi:hypothetical protein
MYNILILYNNIIYIYLKEADTRSSTKGSIECNTLINLGGILII